MSQFINDCRSALRARHLAYQTEKSYIHWIKRYIYFHNKQHPEALDGVAVVQFLNHTALNRQCSPATQSQALCALVFLYKFVVQQPFGNLSDISLAKKKYWRIVNIQLPAFL